MGKNEVKNDNLLRLLHEVLLYSIWIVNPLQREWCNVDKQQNLHGTTEDDEKMGENPIYYYSRRA